MKKNRGVQISELHREQLLGILESFFKAYPPEEARNILWKWYSLKVELIPNELTKGEIQQFTDFFDQLHKLILAENLFFAKADEKQ